MAELKCTENDLQAMHSCRLSETHTNVNRKTGYEAHIRREQNLK